MPQPPFTEENLPPGIPSEAVEFLRGAGYFNPDALAAGDPAPDPPLRTLAGEPVRLSTFWRERPVVLIFGSYT